MNAHQVLIIFVVDTRILCCIADSFQERRFASISPTDYKDTKASIFRSEVIGTKVAHGRCGWNPVDEGLRGNAAGQWLWLALVGRVCNFCYMTLGSPGARLFLSGFLFCLFRIQSVG